MSDDSPRGKRGVVAAVDLGASSGRVMLGRVGPGELAVHAVARFANDPVRYYEGRRDALHWNITELYHGALGGIRAALRDEPALASIGVDAWAVDYALLRAGRMVGNPYHYRDDRVEAAIHGVHSRISPAELYAANGLQHLPFNTVYQLVADRDTDLLAAADSFLLLPDLLAYWLSGERHAERSNASTTGLLNATTREWDASVIARAGLQLGIFPSLVDAGTTIGGLLPSVATELGASGSVAVTAVGSHDTASAVVAVPMNPENSAYISCGTWGLVGVELEHPVLSEASRAANFTNEGGVDGRIRYLHNVMGLWLLSESLRTWEREGRAQTLAELLAQAADVTAPVAVFDTNDPRFLAPGDMPARIVELCRERVLPVPATPAEVVRSILESLAEAFADAVRTAAALSGRRVETIHLVGGGSQNALLCQLTADRSGLPVLAGPAEATAIGNVLVQARAHGFAPGSLESLRALVAGTFAPRRFDPAR